MSERGGISEPSRTPPSDPLQHQLDHSHVGLFDGLSDVLLCDFAE